MLPSTRLHVARGLFHLTPRSAAIYALFALWYSGTTVTPQGKQRVNCRPAPPCYANFTFILAGFYKTGTF